MKKCLLFLGIGFFFVFPLLAEGNSPTLKNSSSDVNPSKFEYYDDLFVYLDEDVSYLEDDFQYEDEALKEYSDLFVYYEDEMLYLEDELLYKYLDTVYDFHVLLLDTQDYLSSEIFPSELFKMNPATIDILKGAIVLTGIIIVQSVFPGVGWAIPFVSTFQKGTSSVAFAAKLITATVASGVASGIVDTAVDWAQDGVIEDETFYAGFANGFKWAAYTYAIEMGFQAAKYQFGKSNPTKGLMSSDDYAKVKGREVINKEYENIRPLKQNGATVSPEYLKAVDDGVPLVNGHRDFSAYSRGSYEFKAGVLTGDVTKDKKILKAVYNVSMDDYLGCTLHHAPDGRTLMMVPTDLHSAVRHTGGNALIQTFTQTISTEMKRKQVRDYTIAISGGVVIGQMEDISE